MNDAHTPMIKLMDEFLKKYGVPGMSVCIAREGNVEFSVGRGLASLDEGRKVTPDSVFRIASLSKPITSVAMHLLFEQNKVAPGDRVFGEGGILGNSFGSFSADNHLTAITIDQLLTHSVGVWANDEHDPMFADVDLTAEALICKVLANTDMSRPPGLAHTYSNFGYCILGRIIEAVSGQSYADFVAQNVLLPAGATAMRIGNSREIDAVANEVTYFDAEQKEWPYQLNIPRMDAHGGWVATAPDLVKFLISLDAHEGAKKILKPETIAEMVRPSSVQQHYARGWAVNQANNWWHTGSLPGTLSIMVRTSVGLCWAALCNARSNDETIYEEFDHLIWKMVVARKLWKPH